MPCRDREIFVLLIAAAIGMLSGSAVQAQGDSHATNDLPNPYRHVENWAQLPAGIEWGQVISVQPDARGNIWVFHRKDPPILEIRYLGKARKEFRSGHVRAASLADHRP